MNTEHQSMTGKCSVFGKFMEGEISDAREVSLEMFSAFGDFSMSKSCPFVKYMSLKIILKYIQLFLIASLKALPIASFS